MAAARRRGSHPCCTLWSGRASLKCFGFSEWLVNRLLITVKPHSEIVCCGHSQRASSWAFLGSSRRAIRAPLIVPLMRGAYRTMSQSRPFLRCSRWAVPLGAGFCPSSFLWGRVGGVGRSSHRHCRVAGPPEPKCGLPHSSQGCFPLKTKFSGSSMAQKIIHP